MTNAERDKLIEQHIPLCKHIAMQCSSHYPPRYWDRFDAAARVGLVQAAYRFDGRVKFITYAHRRIKGAVLDEIRHLCRKEIRERTEADYYDPDKHASALRNTRVHVDREPAFIVDEYVQQILSILSPQQRQVLSAIYIEGLSARAVADRMGVTQSRIAQVRRAALTALRRHYTAAA